MYRSQMAFAALHCLAADGTTAPVETAPAPLNTVATWEFPQFAEGTKHSFDCAQIPGNVRLDFLFGAVRQYIANRLNSVHTRHGQDEKVKAWFAYDEATKADPLQSVVAKPDFERPDDPNFQEAFERAVADLIAGNVRKVSGEPKAKKTKDPLVATVTDAVVREVYQRGKAENPKYTFLEARKAVGPDGIAYLNAMIEERVASGVDRALLEKMREERYIMPAKVMLGLTTTKKTEGPSILGG